MNHRGDRFEVNHYGGHRVPGTVCRNIRKLFPFNGIIKLGRKQQKSLRNIIIKCMGSKCIFNIYIVLFLSLLSNCGDRNTNKDKEKMVECRLYWISDTYPKETDNTKSTDMRFIRLHYLIINNMKYEVFLPIEGLIHSEGDTTICSKMCAYINNRPIYTWFSTDTRWKGVLKPNDSIHAELKIPEWILDSAKVNKKIDLLELIKVFEVRYNRCLSDTMYSSLPISQLYFTYNDTLAIHYKDKNEGLKTQDKDKVSI